MSRIAIENGCEFHFLRIKDEIKMGGSHLLLVILEVDDEKFLEIDANDTHELRKNWKKTMKEEFNNDSTLVDMGMILRENGQVVIEKKSETFDYPNNKIVKATRDKTIETLNRLYPDEIIMRRDC